MIDALVFSRDRPMQLEACLWSLHRNVECRSTVVWMATDESFREGYEKIALGDVTMVEQVDFEDDVKGILPTLAEYVLPLCDDSITYLPAPADPTEAFANDVICMGLRLGRNTTYCHPRDLHHGVPDFEERGPFIVWPWQGPTPDGALFEWQGKEGDFGYPYSLDGTIHRRDSLISWVADGSFVNPNQMEGCVVHSIGQRRDLPQLMACFPHSIQVGLPINVVNQTHGNRFGLVYPQETRDLNDRFLRGERANLGAMDFSNVTAAHQEIRLEFA